MTDLKQNAKTVASFALKTFALTLLTYAVGATVYIRIQHPDFTETQVLIKIFIWDYEGE